MNQTLVPFQELLDRQGREAATKLQELALAKNVSAVFHSGSWSNENGIVMSYLSYYPNTAGVEKTTEALVSLKITPDQALLEADICYPDGAIIREIDSRTMRFATLDTLLLEVQVLSKEVYERVFTFFASEI